jgi:adenylate cyclase
VIKALRPKPKRRRDALRERRRQVQPFSTGAQAKIADPSGTWGTTLALARLWGSRRFRAIVGAQAIGVLVALMWSYGVLQLLELQIYDALLVAWAGHAKSNHVLLVGATEEDIHRFNWPLRDGDLARLLERIAGWQPRVIAVDIYRDIPVPPGTEQLAAVLARHRDIVWAFRLKTGTQPGVGPPAALRGTDQIALADVIPDSLVSRGFSSFFFVRRGLLYADDGVNNYPTLGMAMATGYLAGDHIVPTAGPDGYLRLGKALVAPLDNSRGPYVRVDSRGYQILLDYRGGPDPFPKKSVGDIMDSDVVAPLVRGRAVIIGNAGDHISTPVGLIAGIALHANVADQLIREALGRSPIGGLSRPYEALLIWFCAVVGTLVGAKLHTRLGIASAVVAALCILGAIVYGSFGFALWLPAIPAAIAMTVALAGPASWEVSMVSRLQRQSRELRRVRLLASGRQLLLLALMQQADGTEGTSGTDNRGDILRELVAALAAVDPGKANWTDD